MPPSPTDFDLFLPLLDRARRADGHPPVSDQALLEARAGARDILTVDGGLAVVSRADRGREAGVLEVELVVDPPARGRGVGGDLAAMVVERAAGGSPPTVVLAWAHGDHPASRALAARFGFEPVRHLLELRSTAIRPQADPAVTRAFRPGVDDAQWLRVNAAAFASHPEQGRMSQADLDARMAESWFDGDDLLLALHDDGTVAGFCWLKTDESPAEFYAVGVDPAAQGRGLGRGLVNAGLARLEALGVTECSLYVESDSVAAVALYRSVGFVEYSVDIQYRRPA